MRQILDDLSWAGLTQTTFALYVFLSSQGEFSTPLCECFSRELAFSESRLAFKSPHSAADSSSHSYGNRTLGRSGPLRSGPFGSALERANYRATDQTELFSVNQNAEERGKSAERYWLFSGTTATAIMLPEIFRCLCIERVSEAGIFNRRCSVASTGRRFRVSLMQRDTGTVARGFALGPLRFMKLMKQLEFATPCYARLNVRTTERRSME